MIPVAPVALPIPENVSVVGESLIPLVDSNRIPTAGTFSGIGSATGATGIITEFALRIPLNSKVGVQFSRIDY